MKNIKCGDKKVKVSQKMFIKKDGVYGKILVNENCPHVNDECSNCKNCYGKIALVEVDVFDIKFGDYKPSKEILRDRFYEKGQDIVSKLDATAYINSCDVISISEEDKKDNVGSMGSPWHYGDRSATWKTDCKVCKKKYENKNELTPCQKATKFYEDKGINLKIATEKQIIETELPDECVCREARQRILKFF